MFIEADSDDRLKRALKARINTYDDEFFVVGDMVSFKEDDKPKWAGPAKIIGVDGKVLMLKYGNNPRRVHKSKAVKFGNEFGKQNDKTTDPPTEDKPKTPQNIDENPSTQQTEVNETDAEPVDNVNDNSRRTALRRPEVKRRIQFKKPGSAIWYEGEVTHAGDLKEKEKLAK